MLLLSLSHVLEHGRSGARLIAPEKTPPSPYVMARQGLAYLTFIVDDMDGVIARLRKAHVKMMFDGKKVEVRPGIFALYTYDPEDNILEFVQFADITKYCPDIYSSGSQPKKP